MVISAVNTDCACGLWVGFGPEPDLESARFSMFRSRLMGESLSSLEVLGLTCFPSEIDERPAH